MQDGVDAHQELSRHRDERLPMPLALGQSQVRLTQGSGAAEDVLGVLDENPAEVATALVGDAAAMSCPRTLVDSWGQAGIPHLSLIHI